MRSFLKFGTILGILAALLPQGASAFSYTFTVGTGPGFPHAEAIFESVDANTLQITLRNTETDALTDQSQLLHDLFFNFAGNTTLTLTSATASTRLMDNKNVTTCSSGSCLTITAENGLASNISGQNSSNTTLFGYGSPYYMLGSVGYSLSGAPSTIAGGPQAKYGISGTGGIGTKTNGDPLDGFKNDVGPYVQDATIYVLHSSIAIDPNADASVFQNVTFQFGTTLGGGNGGTCTGVCTVTATPEPFSLAMLGAVVVVIGRSLKRRMAA